MKSCREAPRTTAHIPLRAAFQVCFALIMSGSCFTPLGVAQETQHRHTPEMREMAGPSPAQIAKLEADKRFSEFNHRFAGLFVLLAGLVTAVAPRLARRFSSLRYFWAALFFIPGLYLLILSDPESWPVGNQTLYHVITVNHQVLQHKVFSLILLVLAVVEFLRVRKQLRSVWAVGLFPALAAAGAVLLLFHPHPASAGVPMTPQEHLAMLRVEHQHLGFAIAGFGIAVSKAVLDLGRFHPRLLRNLFAFLMMVLGVLLLIYKE